jgi:hypothetical protein
MADNRSLSSETRLTRGSYSANEGCPTFWNTLINTAIEHKTTDMEEAQRKITDYYKNDKKTITRNDHKTTAPALEFRNSLGSSGTGNFGFKVLTDAAYFWWLAHFATAVWCLYMSAGKAPAPGGKRFHLQLPWKSLCTS